MKLHVALDLLLPYLHRDIALFVQLLLLTAAKNGRVSEVESLLNDPKTDINYQQHFVSSTAIA